MTRPSELWPQPGFCTGRPWPVGPPGSHRSPLSMLRACVRRLRVLGACGAWSARGCTRRPPDTAPGVNRAVCPGRPCGSVPCFARSVLCDLWRLRCIPGWPGSGGPGLGLGGPGLGLGDRGGLWGREGGEGGREVGHRRKDADSTTGIDCLGSPGVEAPQRPGRSTCGHQGRLVRAAELRCLRYRVSSQACLWHGGRGLSIWWPPSELTASLPVCPFISTASSEKGTVSSGGRRKSGSC